MHDSEIDKMLSTLDETAGILKRQLTQNRLLSNNIDEEASKLENVENKHQSQISEPEMESQPMQS